MKAQYHGPEWHGATRAHHRLEFWKCIATTAQSGFGSLRNSGHGSLDHGGRTHGLETAHSREAASGRRRTSAGHASGLIQLELDL